MPITANIVLDSISPDGVRLTTFVLRYPRFIHSEFMTHRAFSRNASSSRAIPFTKQVSNTLNDIAYPLDFRSNKKGMAAGKPLVPWRQAMCRFLWRTHAYTSAGIAWCIHKLGAHKQYANRLLEPTSHIEVVVTATDWNNFYALRCHPAAQPEIAELARKMWQSQVQSQPKTLKYYEWHLPFVSKEEIDEMLWICAVANQLPRFDDWLPLIKRSVARCARVSYLNHYGKSPTLQQDLDLYDRLVGSTPIHASPTEHQARPGNSIMGTELPSNLNGWMQFRKTLTHENVTDFKPDVKY